MSATVHPDGAARPQRADARRNRERIAAAARKVFSEHGSVAQIDLIAKEAGVGVGTVYRHFPTKDVLVGELVRQKFVDIEAHVRPWLEVEDPWGAFEGMMRESVERAKGDAVQQRLMWDAPPAAYALAEDALLALKVTGGRLIARGQEAGVLRPDFGPDDIGTFMCALGCVLEVERRADGSGHDADRLLEIWLSGVRT